MRRLEVALVAVCAAGLAAQEPAALPAVVRVDGGALAGTAADVGNLEWEVVRVADLPLLVGRGSLRRLQINPDTDAIADWQQITVEQLRPLTALPALVELTLPFCCHVEVEHLRLLAGCPRLASICFVNEALVLDADAAAELAAWPSLHQLTLSHLKVESAGLRGLEAAAGLRRLALQGCRGLDQDGLQAVAALPLEALVLERLGQPDLLARFTGGDTSPSWALHVAAMRQLASMSTLRELILRSCVLGDEVLAELPTRLTSLTLEDAEASPAALRHVRRLADLRHLSWRLPARSGDDAATTAAADDAATADVLGALRLQSLHWSGALRPAVRKAIGSMAGLERFEGPCDDDLAFLAGLPEVHRLVLAERPAVQQADGSWLPSPPAPASFAPLRGCRALTEVVYSGPLTDAERSALQQALGDRITLLQHD
ncbi:MAG: hypothetical protein H6835_13795 [Planctomycetes bacterium]|nr:hypothetical protein [Planctomycetota bacterium]